MIRARRGNPANRYLLATTIGAATLSLVLAACGTSSSSTANSGQQSGKPISGGTLVVGENSDEPTSLNPAQLADTNTTILLRPIFDTLVWETPQHTFEGDLASSWDITNNGKTYTFHLRKGVTFQDGSQWNAAALQTNLQYIVNPATKSPLSASYIAPYQGSKIINNYTLQVNLSTPYSSFINVLAQSYLSMISPKQIKDAPQTIATHPIGSGPYKFVKWVKGQYVEYQRWNKYDWAPAGIGHQGPAYIQTIKIEFIDEDSVRYNAVNSGDVDIIENTPPQDVSLIKKNPNLGFTSLERPGHPFAFWFNTARAPFNDVRVRQALVDAVNRTALVKAVGFGAWQTASGYITPATPDYAPNTTPITYDPAAANKLLDEAGWTGRDAAGYRTKDGKELTAYYPDAGVNPQTTQFAQLIQAAAKKIGINIVIQEDTDLQASNAEETGNFDLSAGIWTTNTADVLWIQYDSQNITTPQRQGQNSSGLRNAQLDSLVQEARETTNATLRSSLYSKAQELLVKLAPAIPLYIRPDLVTYTKSVRNVGFDYAYGALDFYNTWLDK